MPVTLSIPGHTPSNKTQNFPSAIGCESILLWEGG